ncbi:T6SS phospholipase effector Tle1-like catalytic domain-containing protein [Pleionea mediterranea]|uniref:Putative alpha/beta hydrolase family protein DUF2235 n=1 Tax=Pleionea mediterranea TaxID=523701 RepID=A0A316FYS4_9GAMM|nr:DUF2235 domain-containing protein [Pleionea mediterranea]PWK53801.1 putative alpha/beta hydrolase family protein DUF2235 [Pleionea mediterranea]
MELITNNDDKFFQHLQSRSEQSEQLSQKAIIQSKPLSGYRKAQLPDVIRQSLTRQTWCDIPRDKRELFRYDQQCQFWCYNKGRWEQVGFRQYDSDNKALGFAPLKAVSDNNKTVSSGHVVSDATQQAANQFFRAINEFTHSQAIPTVTLLSPDNGQIITLEKSNKTQMRFAEHTVQPGEDAAAIAFKYSGKKEPRQVYGFNSHVSQTTGLTAGTLVRVPSGWNVLIEGSVSNHDSVELKWRGPGSGAKRIDVPVLAQDQRHYWDAALSLEPGKYQLTATAGSAVSQIEFTVEAVKELQFGVFFDGTGNNRQVDMQCADDDYEPTNIAKLFELYPQQDTQGTGAAYIKGVGTYDDQLSCEVGEKPEYSNIEQAFGLNVNSRIEEALSKLKLFLERFDSYKRVNCNFDVMGFSRGAATARAFINRLHQMKKMPNNGYWRKGQLTITIRFCGLFDTVGSMGLPGDDDNMGFNLNIGWTSAKSVYHLTAYHEFREYFPLSSIKNQAGKLPAPHFNEEVLPGAHSDIGGGYGGEHIERTIYLEQQQVTWIGNSDSAKQHALARVQQRLDYWQQQKAALGGKVELEADTETQARDNVRLMTVYIVWKRFVKKELAFVALEKMHSKALEKSVPFNDMSQLAQFELDYRISPQLQQIYAKAEGGDDSAMHQLYRDYIHHSHSPITPKETSFNANKAESQQREVFYNQPFEANT